MKNNLMKKMCVLLVLTGASAISHAVQYVDATEGSAKTVMVSSKELTRIAIEGGKILKVQVTRGEIESNKDNENGEIYLKPLVKKSINVFVVSEGGKNYLLTLKPSDMPADSIVIREAALNNQRADLEERNAREQRRAIARNSEAYMSAVKKFIYGMATGNLGDDITKTISGEQVPLWDEALLIRTARYNTPDLFGQSLTLNNTSSSVMVIEEQEFYKKGVVAVSIKQLVLQPGEQTEIFVVSGASQ
jgi:conjugal transfer pilus assembly protein TraK